MRLDPAALALTVLLFAGSCASPPPSPPSPLPDDVQARWLREDVATCDQGDAMACERVGDRYVDREPGRPDGRRAATYYERACETGANPACLKLARLLTEGQLVEPDAYRARSLFARACDAGDVDACYELAVSFVNGDGGARDPAAAAPLLEKACAHDQSRACDALDSLERERMVRPDLGRFGAGAPPPEVTLARTSAPWAEGLRDFFPDLIATPFPYRASELPVAPADLCRFTNVRVASGREGFSITGRLSVGPLPPTLGIGRRSASPGGYRRWLMAFVIGRDGRASWSAEATSVGREWSGPEGVRSAPFTVRGAAPATSLAGATLVLVLSGDPLTVSPLDRGGIVILGRFTKRL